MRQYSGSHANMNDGLQNVVSTLQKLEMIAVSTTCMAEVIGDDLQAFTNNAKKDGFVPKDFPSALVHIPPSFVWQPHWLGQYV